MSTNGDGGESAAPRDRRAEYALTLQKAYTSAIDRVKSNELIANSSWAAPLAAAPSAISTMAILLKAADQKAAAGLEVESQEVLDGDKVVGKLPSKYCHTNLQHCSDVGRLAFLDAQNAMSIIRSTALRMITTEGSIAYILELLENPEDARYNLKPEIEAIRKTAQKCLENAQLITAKFRYWHLVIMHLKQTSLSRKGQVVNEKKATSLQQKEELRKEQEYTDRKQSLKETIKSLREKDTAAQHRVDRKEQEVHYLRFAPVQPEPSVLEEIEMVRRMIPQTEAPMIDRGGFVGLKNAFFGQSTQHHNEDKSARERHGAQIEKMREAALDQARQVRMQKLDRAARELREAKDEEAKLVQALDDSRRELSDSRDQLAEVNAKLEEVKNEFERLQAKDLELQGILSILDNSSRDLGDLKDKIEDLVGFFQTMLREIQENVDGSLGDFLRPIENGMTHGGTPEEVEALRVSRKSKQRLMTTALQMQGRFSAIADISTAYVTVSADYIRPAINEMENLSTMTQSEWAVQSKHFLEKCNAWGKGIEDVTKKASGQMENNARRNMNALQMRAIEAAAEDDD
ncbi:hypothetical protein QBC37DRAFT_298078 [Rhypophila decipiens]|uniref:Uncharacterized protein n=1 Tax=Rhypophila decipiens TaxID=261697 RepID=A0AAN7B2P7_9PEZI|nr:hypothetical protein QBC37DRAFT_298078 [Rhypophila decipiens]